LDDWMDQINAQAHSSDWLPIFAGQESIHATCQAAVASINDPRNSDCPQNIARCDDQIVEF